MKGASFFSAFVKACATKNTTPHFSTFPGYPRLQLVDQEQLHCHFVPLQDHQLGGGCQDRRHPCCRHWQRRVCQGRLDQGGRCCHRCRHQRRRRYIHTHTC